MWDHPIRRSGVRQLGNHLDLEVEAGDVAGRLGTGKEDVRVFAGAEVEQRLLDLGAQLTQSLPAFFGKQIASACAGDGVDMYTKLNMGAAAIRVVLKSPGHMRRKRGRTWSTMCALGITWHTAPTEAMALFCCIITRCVSPRPAVAGTDGMNSTKGIWRIPSGALLELAGLVMMLGAVNRDRVGFLHASPAGYIGPVSR